MQDTKREISWSTRLKVALDVARGMFFLHKQTPPIIHRDLKSANVLVCSRTLGLHICSRVQTQIDCSGPEIHCRIADFGSAIAESRIRRRVVDNPVWYIAPTSCCILVEVCAHFNLHKVCA